MSVLVFDLDDTLYEELSFVYSGFRAVSDFLYERFGAAPETSYGLMVHVLQTKGRGEIFDTILRELHHCTVKNVRECLSVYRGHKPDIRLYEDAAACLEAFKDYPIYIVTDGNKLVQQNKLQSLQLYDHPAIKRCFISRRFGVRNEKPSPYCFHKICELERCAPQEVVYIGDNPNKDFVGIKPLGFRTVRVLRGAYQHVTKPPEFEAEYTVTSLDQLWDLRLQIFS